MHFDHYFSLFHLLYIWIHLSLTLITYLNTFVYYIYFNTFVSYIHYIFKYICLLHLFKYICLIHLLYIWIHYYIFEYFFSLLRLFGTSHPGPVDVMHKIKLILAAANPKNALSVSNPSVEMETPQESEEKDTEFVSSLISSILM